jgi:phage gp29-like protein
MEASSAAYMFKHLPLKDWLLYCDKHGMPGVQGKTNAAKNSAEWNNMVDAVEAIASDFSCVTSKDDEIAKIDLSQSGELPFPPLVDRMDRAMSALWRGGDLSSMSSTQGQGQGASVQGDEADLLEQDDAELISESLNSQIDPWVIRYAIGDETPLAYVKIIVPEKKNTDQDLKIDTFLRDSGIPLDQQTTVERYGRTLAEAGAAILQKPTGTAQFLPNERRGSGLDQATQKLIATARLQLAEEQARVLQPVVKRLAKAADAADPVAELKKVQSDLPDLLKEINANPETAKLIEEIISAAVVNGMAKAKQER